MSAKKYSDWDCKEFAVLKRLQHPMDIQLFLNGLRYDPDNECRSPRTVIKEQKAHCFEGALLAAAALRCIGCPPLVLDMMAANDDDHVIAVFRKFGCWGAVAKSNCTTLRYREPVYRSLRELVMSYFDVYFNVLGEKTLRSYTKPVDLSIFDQKHWMTTSDDLELIGDYLTNLKHYPLLSPAMIRSLQVADRDVLDASLLGSVPEGLYKPKKKVRR